MMPIYKAPIDCIGIIFPDAIYPLDGEIILYDKDKRVTLIGNAHVDKASESINCKCLFANFDYPEAKEIEMTIDGVKNKVRQIKINSDDIPTVYKYEYKVLDYNGSDRILIKGTGKISCDFSFSIKYNQTVGEFLFYPMKTIDKNGDWNLCDVLMPL